VETLSVRVDKLERDTAELFEKTNTAAVSLAAVNEKLNSLLVTLGEVKQAVSNLRDIPAKRLENILKALATAVLSGITGYILARFR
ncbi:MAG TPA: hypothetical protein VHR42_03635, partial [Clostridia bacterium]|nr:hypothetical protein [Clostridia bacterium]